MEKKASSLFKLAVLASGNGTNLQAIIDAINNQVLNHVEIELVISNKKDAYALTRAIQNGITSMFIDKNEWNTLLQTFNAHNIDLIVLAGYLPILKKEIVEKYKNQIINIHPSLLPSFGGKCFYGDKVHEAVLDSGVETTGATVHFVDSGIDTGDIFMQKPVTVLKSDTVRTLKQRVQKAEHEVLVESIKLLAEI